MNRLKDGDKIYDQVNEKLKENEEERGNLKLKLTEKEEKLIVLKSKRDEVKNHKEFEKSSNPTALFLLFFVY